MTNTYQDAFTAVTEKETKAGRFGTIDDFGFSIPSDADIALIAGFTPILEVGAGRAYWSSLLDAAGADVVATDPTPWGVKSENLYTKISEGQQTKSDFFVITAMDMATAVATFPGRTVLSVWPDYPFDTTDWSAVKRVVVVQWDEIADIGWDLHSGPLTAGGLVMVTQYDKTEFWPRYEDRLEVWERPA